MVDSQSPGDTNTTILPDPQDRRVPAKSALAALPIEQLNLSLRSYNVLIANRIQTIEELTLLTDEELLEFPSFGIKCLNNVQRAVAEFLSTHAAQLAVADGGVPRDEKPGGSFKLAALSATAGSWGLPHHDGRKNRTAVITDDMLAADVEILDLSTRSLNVLNRLGIASIGQLLAYPKSRLFKAKSMGRKSMNDVTSKLFAYLSRKQQTGPRPRGQNSNRESAKQALGTRAFVDQMLSLLPDRQHRVIAGRFGLWSGAAKTLQELGDGIGLTRERVRQLEQKGLKRLRRVYGHEAIRQFVSARITSCAALQDETACGILAAGEMIDAFADDCSAEEAKLALGLLRNVSPGSFARLLIEAEPGIYCVNVQVAADYRKLFKRIELTLQREQRPISEEALLAELSASGRSLSKNQRSLLGRFYRISPSVVRLRDGSIALSRWTTLSKRTVITLTEAALRLLGRPAHFREIAEKIVELFPDAGPMNERTIRNALVQNLNKFGWVTMGTYGLTAWGIKKAAYASKDRPFEIASGAHYHLRP